MKKFGSVNEVLDYAISEEEKAHDFYIDLSHKVDKPWMKKALEDFAKEEAGHKQKLLGVKNGKHLAPAETKVLDLQLSDYLVDVEPKPSITYQDALIIAMKKEKAAWRLYMDLAAATADVALQNTFKALAVEEANHKLRFETEYDETMLREG
ncbi:MAG: ferritin family protein [Deltaproteobacteria bacterium]|nr:ferritin family protein [Deltaproteobacteria bacterium]